MRKSLSVSFDIMSGILLAAGILFVILTVVLSWESLIAGISLILSYFFVKGFACIVDAACLYVEKNGKSDKEQENEKEKESDSTAESRQS